MKIKDTKRDLDLEYLKQDFRKKPKQLHLETKNLILKNIKKNKKQILKVADIGSADGQFLYLLNKNNSRLFEIEGSDPQIKLIQKAIKDNKKNVKFKIGSILNKNLYKKNSLDIIINTGVLPIFDNYRKFFENLLYWIKPNGLILIAALFNDNNYDVNIKYNSSTRKNLDKVKRLGGWNIYSKKTINLFLKSQKKIQNFKFHDFQLKPTIKYNHKKPLKLWTLKTKKNKNLCINGLSVILDQKLLLIRLKKK